MRVLFRSYSPGRQHHVDGVTERIADNRPRLHRRVFRSRGIPDQLSATILERQPGEGRPACAGYGFQRPDLPLPRALAAGLLAEREGFYTCPDSNRLMLILKELSIPACDFASVIGIPYKIGRA